MNKHQEHIDRAIQRAGEWFEHHRATDVPSVASIRVIDWRRPDTRNYAMRFIISCNYVIVTGDVGDAIYAWGQEVTPKLLLGFDWHYFTSKCVASETGRNYTMKIPGISAPVVNVRAIGHVVGLKMALMQLGFTA